MCRSVMFGRTEVEWHELERALARELGLIRGPLSDLDRLEFWLRHVGGASLRLRPVLNQTP